MKRVSQQLDCPAAKRKKKSHDNRTSCGEVFDCSEELPNVSEKISQSTLFSLNYDCLYKIIGYLSNVDLLHMCMASDRLKKTILNCDLRKRLFDFGEFCSCHILNMFKIFGQHMTNIRISELHIQYELDGISEFDEILRLITSYCSLDTIKHLAVQYIYTSRLHKSFIYNAVPFFLKIESFSIAETDGCDGQICVDYFCISRKYNKSINDFVELVLMQAVNVKSIKLHYVKVTGRFLHLPLSNLTKLQFIGCNIRNSLGIMSFLERKPNLVQFTWINSSVRGLNNQRSTSSHYIFEKWEILEKKDQLKKFYSYPELLYNKRIYRKRYPSVSFEYQDFRQENGIHFFRHFPSIHSLRD